MNLAFRHTHTQKTRAFIIVLRYLLASPEQIFLSSQYPLDEDEFCVLFRSVNQFFFNVVAVVQDICMFK